jgi:DNA/RNA-binding domain of Phe-tRNA-synthetase-like protein
MKIGEFDLGAVDATEYLCRAYTLRNSSETRIKESHDAVAMALAASLNT